MSTEFCDERKTKLFNSISKSSLYQFYQDTTLHYIGDVRGKSVLDVGCGVGTYCRFMKQMGAARVIGVDISQPMIQEAKEYENRSPLGVEYVVADCTRMGILGQFDYVLCNLVLVYAKDKEELGSIVRNIHDNLKVGGHVVALNADTTIKKWHPSMNRLGNGLTEIKNIPNGFRGTLNFTVLPAGVMKATVYLLEPEVYEDVFRAAGLKQLAFNPRYVREETSRRFPQEDSEDYLNHGIMIVLTATK